MLLKGNRRTRVLSFSSPSPLVPVSSPTCLLLPPEKPPPPLRSVYPVDGSSRRFRSRFDEPELVARERAGRVPKATARNEISPAEVRGGGSFSGIHYIAMIPGRLEFRVLPVAISRPMEASLKMPRSRTGRHRFRDFPNSRLPRLSRHPGVLESTGMKFKPFYVSVAILSPSRSQNLSESSRELVDFENSEKSGNARIRSGRMAIERGRAKR